MLCVVRLNHQSCFTTLTSMIAMTAAQTRLSDHIDVFYGAADRTSDGAMAAHAYKRAVEDLDNGVQRELDAPYRTTIMEPLGKMNAYFPIVNEHIAKRNKKVRAFVCSITITN